MRLVRCRRPAAAGRSTALPRHERGAAQGGGAGPEPAGPLRRPRPPAPGAAGPRPAPPPRDDVAPRAAPPAAAGLPERVPEVEPLVGVLPPEVQHRDGERVAG